MILTPAQLDELCARSAGGEGVRAVLAGWGCDDMATLEWLRDNHSVVLKAAKAECRRVGPLTASEREAKLSAIRAAHAEKA